MLGMKSSVKVRYRDENSRVRASTLGITSGADELRIEGEEELDFGEVVVVDETATIVIYTGWIVGGVRCV